MSRITWDKVGDRLYEVGVDRCVFYTEAGGDFISGVPWNGVSEVTPEREGVDISNLYSGDIKRALSATGEEYGGKITAYTYPDEADACFGGVEVIPGLHVYQQDRNLFGFSYRTMVGNDLDGTNFAYKIHLIYNAHFTDVSLSYNSVGPSLDVGNFDWSFITIPMDSEVVKPYSEIVIDTRELDSGFIDILEDILYGTDDDDARMPSLDELRQIYYAWKHNESPEDWDGYPYELLYPIETIYPIANGG